GSLGAADRDVIADVIHCVAGRAPVSAALGELVEANDRLSLPAGLHYAKLGLARCALDRDWPARWADRLAALGADISPVAVAYADWSTAAAPDPRQVLHHAAEIGCRIILLDTYNKRHGTLMDHFP